MESLLRSRAVGVALASRPGFQPEFAGLSLRPLRRLRRLPLGAASPLYTLDTRNRDAPARLAALDADTGGSLRRPLAELSGAHFRGQLSERTARRLTRA